MKYGWTLIKRYIFESCCAWISNLNGFGKEKYKNKSLSQEIPRLLYRLRESKLACFDFFLFCSDGSIVAF